MAEARRLIHLPPELQRGVLLGGLLWTEFAHYNDDRGEQHSLLSYQSMVETDVITEKVRNVRPLSDKH
jgi:hypothetical protein